MTNACRIRLEGKKQAAVTAASEHRTFFLWLFRALSRQGEDIGFGPPPNTALQHLPPNNPQGLLPFLSVKSRFVGPLSVKVLTARGLQTPPPPAEDAGIDWQVRRRVRSSGLVSRWPGHVHISYEYFRIAESLRRHSHWSYLHFFLVNPKL